MTARKAPILPLVITAAYAAGWLGMFYAGLVHFTLPAWLLWAGFGLSFPLGLAWLSWTRGRPRRVQLAVASIVYVFWWHLSVFVSNEMGWMSVRAEVAWWGLGLLFVIGLLWIVWGLERATQYYRAQRLANPSRADERITNPLDAEAWYYGRNSKKLTQSLAGILTYMLAFVASVMLFGQIRGCQEIYESPAGGGKQMTIAQQVKVQKVIKKKFVINPFSAIIFNERKIDDIKLQLMDITQHAYKVGYGEGEGAGFAGGTAAGKVRFIRLEYAGGDWDQDFGIGADLNMLIEYGVRTRHRVSDKTESRTISQLQSFPADKSPPLVYLTGQKNITLSKSEVKTLREYLLNKQGMIFGDNGGSAHFHNQFFAMMRQILPEVEPVKVPLDDVIHRTPFALPYLPYVAPHGGKDAWGWKVDGRWVCYYHPGDIGDAWTDDHSGIKPEIYEACYQLGTNVIFYAHMEYAKWLQARQKK